MSYAELDEHPRKRDLMITAFTLKNGIEDGREILKAREEQKAKLKK